MYPDTRSSGLTRMVPAWDKNSIKFIRLPHCIITPHVHVVHIDKGPNTQLSYLYMYIRFVEP